MTGSKLVAHSIARRLLQQRDQANEQRGHNPWTDRLIAILAVTASLLVLGSYLEELLWAVLAAATIFTLK